MIRMWIAEELRALKVEVVECNSADEAFSYLLTGAPVDLLFTDVKTPGTRDGLQLAAEARDLRPDIPVVVTSAHLGALNEFEASMLFIPKPYSAEKLAAKLSGLIKVRNEKKPGRDCPDC